MLIKSNSQIKNKYNLGLGLLKVILALSVIVSHIFKKKSTNNKFLLYLLQRRRIHVPSFFIMSFYFMYKDLIILNINKIKLRFERLFIPYFFWPIILWIINNILKLIFNIKLSSTLKDLKNQLLWGNNFIIQFWFLWDLIMITVFFIILIFLLKRNSLFYLQLLGIISYIFQYS